MVATWRTVSPRLKDCVQVIRSNLGDSGANEMSTIDHGWGSLRRQPGLGLSVEVDPFRRDWIRSALEATHYKVFTGNCTAGLSSVPSRFRCLELWEEPFEKVSHQLLKTSFHFMFFVLATGKLVCSRIVDSSFFSMMTCSIRQNLDCWTCLWGEEMFWYIILVNQFSKSATSLGPG